MLSEAPRPKGRGLQGCEPVRVLPGFRGIGAEPVEGAGWTFRLSSCAGVSAEKNELKGKITPVFFGDYIHEIIFNFDRIFV